MRVTAMEMEVRYLVGWWIDSGAGEKGWVDLH